MNTRLASTGLLCLLTACSIPSPRLAPRETTTPASVTNAPPGAATMTQQTYAPGEMFMKAHGEYMLHKDPWRPDVRVSFLDLPDSEVKGEAGDFTLRHFRADVEGKVYLPDPDSFLKAGVQYGHRDYQFSSGAVGAHDETLFRVSATVGYGHFLTDDTLLEVDFNPGIYSDFSGTLHDDDWQMYARGLLTFRYAKDLYLKTGVEHSGVFRDLEVYPLVGLTWLIDTQWRVDVLLPRQARLTYDHSASTSFSLGIDIDGGQYQIRSPSPAKVRREVNVQEMELSVSAQHRFNKQMSVFGRVGTTLLGDYRFRSTNATAIWDGTLEPQFFAEIGLGWTF